MARRREDPQVTDLRRYRKAREQEKRRQTAARQEPSQRFFGANPRAKLILGLVVLALLALFVVPRLL